MRARMRHGRESGEQGLLVFAQVGDVHEQNDVEGSSEGPNLLSTHDSVFRRGMVFCGMRDGLGVMVDSEHLAIAGLGDIAGRPAQSTADIEHGLGTNGVEMSKYAVDSLRLSW